MKVLLALTSGGGLLFLLLFLHAEELDILQPAEIGRRREKNLRFRDALRGLEILFLLHSFLRKRGPEPPPPRYYFYSPRIVLSFQPDIIFRWKR